MSDPHTNTSVELIVEAFEDFANAIFDGRETDVDASRDEIDRVTEAVLSARKTLANRLRFFQPKLAVIRGGRQGYTADTQEREKPRCGVCAGTSVCADVNCPHWHAAIRRKMEEKDPEEKTAEVFKFGKVPLGHRDEPPAIIDTRKPPKYPPYDPNGPKEPA